MSDGGWSEARLGRIDGVMAGYVEHGTVPGLVTLVSRRGETRVDAIGTMAEGGSGPMTRDTIFRISSMTKPITAAATMILIEECRLRLDDPVDAWLPELADRRVLTQIDAPLDDTIPAHRPITVRDLLTFRMGFGLLMADPETTPIVRALIGTPLDSGPPSPQGPPAPDRWMRSLGDFPLMYQPGERWMYNTGSDVLGVLIARAAGQPFDVFLRERVFEPLGMSDTGFSVTGDRLDRLATAYWTDAASGALALADEPHGQWSEPPAFPSGAGGLVSTADDYLAFAQMLLDGGRHGEQRILSRPTVETMTTDHLTPEQKALSGIVPGFFDHHGWGFGMSVVTRRDVVAGSIGAFGWDGGMGTSWLSDPVEDLTAILMTQAGWSSPNPPPICRDFWTSVYQAIDD
jgi:CubicO group peptidase (beta-lactamase class C family)